LVRITAFLLLELVAAPALAERVCIPSPWSTQAGVEASEPEIVALVRWLEPTLVDAPLLVDAVERLGPDLCLVPRIDGAEGYLDSERRQIVLDGRAPPALQRGILLHELRHLDQLARGFCPANELAPRENARATYAVEADASAVSLLLAWLRRADGDASAWEALAAWPQQADIAARFADEIAEGADQPTATAAAFAQWYEAQERRESYYIASCSDYLDREDRGRLLRGIAGLPEDFFALLCILPDGEPYPCIEPGFGQR